MAQIKTGTVSVTNGSQVVTGVGTTWLADGVAPGDGFVIPTSTGLNGSGVYYTVAGVASDTSLTLSATWGGSGDSGLAYAIIIDFIAPGYPNLLPGDLEVKGIINQIIQKLLNDKAALAALGTAAFADLTTSATDTTAGRALKVGDGGWLGVAPTRESTDLNAVSVVGRTIALAGAAANNPFGANSLILRQAWDSNLAGFDIGVDVSGQDRIAFRSRAGGTWRGWQELYHTGNILGTVSQSSGVPTGAIIERGSNANGEYVKFADGTLIMQILSTVDLSTSADDDYIYPIIPVLESSSGSVSFGSVPVGSLNAAANVVIRAANSLIRVIKTDSSGVSGVPVQLTIWARWY